MNFTRVSLSEVAFCLILGRDEFEHLGWVGGGVCISIRRSQGTSMKDQYLCLGAAHHPGDEEGVRQYVISLL